MRLCLNIECAGRGFSPGLRNGSHRTNLKRKRTMQTQLSRIMLAVLSTIALAGLSTGCSSLTSGGGEQDVTLEQMSAPARVTASKETTGGQVDKITREVE